MSNPPVYTTPGFTYSDLTIRLNEVKEVVIPAFHDPDGSIVTASVEDMSEAATTISFTLEPDFSKVTLHPTAFSELGLHTMYIVLKDETNT